MSPGFPRSLFLTLAELVDAEVEFDETRSGPGPDDDPFLSGRADLGWICSTSFVELGTRGDDPTIELAGVAWVPDEPDELEATNELRTCESSNDLALGPFNRWLPVRR